MNKCNRENVCTTLLHCFRQYTLVLVASLASLSLVGSGFAQSRQILHAFDVMDGIYPAAPLTLDDAGNLYGTTQSAGGHGQGSVFQLSPGPDGTWKLSILHAFGAFRGDGETPLGGLTFDTKGNLYGTTMVGGYYGWGTVYQLSPSNGTWAYRVLHGFTNHNGDGAYSRSTPAVDANGNIYGTTMGSGQFKAGSAWELSPQPDGSWKETILYSFSRNGELQYTPAVTDVVLGPDGNLYGAAGYGQGINGTGAVFKLAPSGSGAWVETLLYEFGAAGGGDGQCGCSIRFDSAGNLFGVTVGGGSAGYGTVFELPSEGQGSWGTETVLYNFDYLAGGYPIGAPVMSTSGELYGTTSSGYSNSFGGVYELAPSGAGGWIYSTVHRFAGGHDGSGPEASLAIDTSNNIFGTTQGGGIYLGGTAWEITP